ncbi:MAG: putative MarR-family transcriptional regulator [Frankiales bacterium]|nr:putative MarR-family transcriptional regulator [Frankiales bacterium]
MSGPVRADDAPPAPPEPVAQAPVLEVTESRTADVAGLTVRRALPRARRRTVGAWCFVDHLGPAALDERLGVQVGPHPHIGLHTVTWLLEGEQRHRDSLGSDQVIRPGQLNLMTAGAGVVHAEESLDYWGPLHGVQLWVAQPESTRHGEAAFEHHADLPQVELDAAVATVLVGSLDGVRSAARADTPLVGLDLDARAGTSVLPLEPSYEHALVVLSGAVSVDGSVVRPGALAYLGEGRDELAVTAAEPARVLLVGGEPFQSPVLMAWNFVARTREELDAAYADWAGGEERFGAVDTALPRLAAPPPPWGVRGR